MTRDQIAWRALLAARDALRSLEALPPKYSAIDDRIRPFVKTTVASAYIQGYNAGIEDCKTILYREFGLSPTQGN